MGSSAKIRSALFKVIMKCYIIIYIINKRTVRCYETIRQTPKHAEILS